MFIKFFIGSIYNPLWKSNANKLLPFLAIHSCSFNGWYVSKIERLIISTVLQWNLRGASSLLRVIFPGDFSVQLISSILCVSVRYGFNVAHLHHEIINCYGRYSIPGSKYFVSESSSHCAVSKNKSMSHVVVHPTCKALGLVSHLQNLTVIITNFGKLSNFCLEVCLWHICDKLSSSAFVATEWKVQYASNSSYWSDTVNYIHMRQHAER